MYREIHSPYTLIKLATHSVLSNHFVVVSEPASFELYKTTPEITVLIEREQHSAMGW